MLVNHAIPSFFMFVWSMVHFIPTRSFPFAGVFGVCAGLGEHSQGPAPAPFGVPDQVGVTVLDAIETSRCVIMLVESASVESAQSLWTTFDCLPCGQLPAAHT